MIRWFLNRRYDAGVVLLAVVWLAVCGESLGYWEHWETVRWYAPDSQDYRAVADWLFGARSFADVQWQIAWRPIGYPLLLGLCERTGVSMLVLLQGAAWVLSQWMLFRIVLERTRRPMVAVVCAGVSLTCLTPVSMIFTALSEALAIPLFVAALFFLHRSMTARGPLCAVLAMSMAAFSALCRPIALQPAVILGVILVTRHRHQPARLMLLGLAWIPIAIQLFLMFHQFGVCRLSTIDTHTANDYFLARIESRISGRRIDRVMVERYRNVHERFLQRHDPGSIKLYDAEVFGELARTLRATPGQVAAALGENLWYNLRRNSSSLQVVRACPRLQAISGYQNRCLSMGGMFLALLSGVAVLNRLRFRGRQGFTAEQGVEALVAFAHVYFLLASSVSFQQADRFSLFSYPTALILAGLWGGRLMDVRREDSKECIAGAGLAA